MCCTCQNAQGQGGVGDESDAKVIAERLCICLLLAVAQQRELDLCPGEEGREKKLMGTMHAAHSCAIGLPQTRTIQNNQHLVSNKRLVHW